MRRAPARHVRACFVRTCCAVVVQEHDRRAATWQCNAKQTCSSHFTLRPLHPALHTSRFTLHLISSHLSSSHLISLFSPHLGSSHLIPPLFTCHLSKFFLAVFISPEHWSTCLISSKFFSTHLSSSARQKALTVREKSLAQKKHCAQKAFAHRSLRHRCIYTEEFFQTTLCYKACTKHFPALLCTTKLALSTSTLYYKPCREYFPVLPCTTKLAQSTSQYNFLLHSLHNATHVPVLPCTTKLAQGTSQVLLLCYKTCTKHFPVLLRKACASYFVLQILHKARPSTSWYYKACTKHREMKNCTPLWREAHFEVKMYKTHQHRRTLIFRFTKMILRDRCSTSYDLASLFRGRRNTLDRWVQFDYFPCKWLLLAASGCCWLQVATFRGEGGLLLGGKVSMKRGGCCRFMQPRRRMQPMRRRMKLQQLFLKAHIETLKAQTHSPRYNALLGIPSFLKLRYPKMDGL